MAGRRIIEIFFYFMLLCIPAALALGQSTPDNGPSLPGGVAKSHDVVAPPTGAMPSPKKKSSPRPDKDAATPENMFPWLAGTKDQCGQACFQERGTSNLILQAIYAYYQTVALEKKALTDGWGTITKTMAINAPGFCMAGESSKDCFTRYKRLQVLRIFKLRKAIEATKRKTGRLYGQNVLVVPNVEKSKYEAVYIPSFKELQAQNLAEGETLKKIASTDYAELVKNLKPEPDKSDFTVFREVPRDPDKPDSGNKITLVVEKEGDCPEGTKCKCEKGLCYDEDAYAKAMSQFSVSRDVFQKEIEAMGGHAYDPTGIVLDPKLVETQEFIEISGKAFQAARATMIDSVHGKLKESGLKTPPPLIPEVTKVKAPRVPANQGQGGSGATAPPDKGLEKEKANPLDVVNGMPKSEPMVMDVPSDSEAPHISPGLDEKSLMDAALDMDVDGDLVRPAPASTGATGPSGSRNPSQKSPSH